MKSSSTREREESLLSVSLGMIFAFDFLERCDESISRGTVRSAACPSRYDGAPPRVLSFKFKQSLLLKECYPTLDKSQVVMVSEVLRLA